MALKMSPTFLSPFPHFPLSHLPTLFQSPSTAAALSFLLYRINPHAYVSKSPGFFYNPFDSSRFRYFNAKAPAGGRGDGITENPSSSGILSGDLLNLVSAAKDANEALEVIGEVSNRNGGVVSTSDCSSIIAAAIERDNSDLALSIFDAMRSSFDPGVEGDGISGRWKWPRPDVHIYILLVQRLAASLRVLEALRVLTDSCRMGVSSSKEVPFGKVVRCPSCMIAITVAQPQHGIQIASCFKCRYKYELVSGGIVSIDSKEISIDAPAWKRGLSFLQIMKQNIPAAVHSIVVNTPSGTARTHKFATKTVDLPAQKGERVTIALAAPSSIYTEVGPFKFYPKATNFYPGEPICLTNHIDGRESLLLRAPVENGSSSLLDPSFVIPLFAVLATGDAATGIIDPNLPKFISAAAVAILALGAAINTLVLPQLNRLPQRLVDATVIRQELLSQYDGLQYRIKDLKESAEKEVWMLARMCQLEKKIVVIGEPSYHARRVRVKRVRETLEKSLRGLIELICSYARISSMIEIEVEMDSDVLAAESSITLESVAEQIKQMMELERMEEKWRIQAAANDEVERLVGLEPMSAEKV